MLSGLEVAIGKIEVVFFGTVGGFCPAEEDFVGVGGCVVEIVDGLAFGGFWLRREPDALGCHSPLDLINFFHLVLSIEVVGHTGDRII